MNRDIAEQLVTVRYQLRQQADQLVERQLFIERLQGKLQVRDDSPLDFCLFDNFTK